MTETPPIRAATSAADDVHFWVVTATIARVQGQMPPQMPDVVLDGIIKLLSPPGYLHAGDLTHPVVKAAYASINHALYQWPSSEESTDG